MVQRCQKHFLTAKDNLEHLPQTKPYTFTIQTLLYVENQVIKKHLYHKKTSFYSSDFIEDTKVFQQEGYWKVKTTSQCEKCSNTAIFYI